MNAFVCLLVLICLFAVIMGILAILKKVNLLVCLLFFLSIILIAAGVCLFGTYMWRCFSYAFFGIAAGFIAAGIILLKKSKKI